MSTAVPVPIRGKRNTILPDGEAGGDAYRRGLIMAGSLMPDYLGEKHGEAKLADAAPMIEPAIDSGLADSLLRPMEFGGSLEGIREPKHSPAP